MKQTIQEFKSNFFRLLILRPMFLLHDIKMALSEVFPSSMSLDKSAGAAASNNIDTE